MAKRRMKKAVKRLSAPTAVFAQKAKKPEPDDMPGKMRPAGVGHRKGMGRAGKKLRGVML
jgi:hypothetical protein